MAQILVDTSAWIEIFKKNSRFKPAEDELMSYATCPPVLQELFQGLRDTPDRLHLQSSLLALPCLCREVPQSIFLQASELYRLARKKGFTVRSSVDCLIGAIAISNNVAVLHRDRDYEHISRISSLKCLKL